MVIKVLSPKVKFGITIPHHLDFDDVKRIVAECERLGFDSVWRNDHFFLGPEPFFECWTTLSALSSVTSSIKLGTLVLNNSFRHPSLLAKMVATLDIISNGRLIVGIGAGWYEKEFTAHAIPFPKHRERVQQLEEAIMVMKKMWTEEKVSYQGRYYSIRDAICNPKPVQKPHPQLWIGGLSDSVLKLTVDLADGWNGYGVSKETFGQKVATIDEYCRKAGKKCDEFEKSIAFVRDHCIIARSREEMRERLHRFRREEMTMEEYVEKVERSISGTPDECIEKIQEFISSGATYLLLGFPDMREMDSLRMFAELVIPHFK